MKKLSLFALAAAGLFTLGACSDKDVADEGGNVFKDKGVGYFKVNVNLPTTITTTRADEEGWNEDNYSDSILAYGKASEYAVDNVLLVLFGSDTDDESAATVVQVQLLTDYRKGNVTPNKPNQVEDSITSIVALSQKAQNKNFLYALAVINGTGVIDANGNDAIKINSSTAVTTLAGLQDEVTKATAYGDNKFLSGDDKHIFMTNAVLSNVHGGKKDPGTNPALHILAPVNKSYIYEKESDAKNGVPATDIYVERGVAKVTINSFANTVNSSIKTKGSTDAVTATFGGWCLDRTNSRSYIVRKVPTFEGGKFAWNYVNSKAKGDKYRFVGGYPVDEEYGTATAGYRTYWAVDPNYTGALTDGDLLSPTKYDKENDSDTDFALTNEIGVDNPLYCYENTFDVDNQSYKNTTHAVIKVNLGGTTTFYTVGADRKTLYPESEVKTLIANALNAISEFKTWFDTNHATGHTNLFHSDLDIDWGVDAGIVTINKITVKKDALSGDADQVVGAIPTDGATIMNTVKAQVANIKRYVNGATYYAIRIQHFGEDLTPWNSEEANADTYIAPKESEITTIYPGTGDKRNASYLGRYGVVRNNWYDLKITEISKIGAATPDELKATDHPDDELEDAFIKARINILTWAKRPQSWKLK